MGLILTFFVSAIILYSIILPLVYGQINTNVTIPLGKQITSAENSTRVDLMINPNFTFFNDTSGLPSYWNDPLKTCRITFSCTIKFTDGWNDYVSFSLSTTDNTNQTWSSIYGKEIDVTPNGTHQLVSHVKLNDWATQSHVVLEGLNETSKQWYQIIQCPTGINGPLEWHEFSCIITIPENTFKIRPVLNAGWSSDGKNEATTWFDGIDILASVPS
jgi:hypothetical protein